MLPTQHATTTSSPARLGKAGHTACQLCYNRLGHGATGGGMIMMHLFGDTSGCLPDCLLLLLLPLDGARLDVHVAALGVPSKFLGLL